MGVVVAKAETQVNPSPNFQSETSLAIYVPGTSYSIKLYVYRQAGQGNDLNVLLYINGTQVHWGQGNDAGGPTMGYIELTESGADVNYTCAVSTCKWNGPTWLDWVSGTMAGVASQDWSWLRLQGRSWPTYSGNDRNLFVHAWKPQGACLIWEWASSSELAAWTHDPSLVGVHADGYLYSLTTAEWTATIQPPFAAIPTGVYLSRDAMGNVWRADECGDGVRCRRLDGASRNVWTDATTKPFEGTGTAFRRPGILAADDGSLLAWATVSGSMVVKRSRNRGATWEVLT